MGNRRGFALAAALMVLALLSVLGAAALQSGTLEVQLSAADRDARFALYLAQAALSEARYYAARGWGRASLRTSDQVVVETLFPPGTPWSGDLYRGFTFSDRNGAGFLILSNTAGASSPVITLGVAGSPPAAGRFSLYREIPSARWDSPYLIVEDDPWANASTADCWTGWTLWDRAGTAFRVTGSSVCPAAVGPGLALRLKLSKEPGPGPYVLSFHPWLGCLAAGASSPAGDAEPGLPGWTRLFRDGAGRDFGRATVVGALEEPGRYLLTCTSSAGNRQAKVTARVYRAGRSDQRFGDWRVQ